MSITKGVIAPISILLICFLTACQPKKVDLITQKWKTTDIKNNSLENELAYYEQMVDTITEKNEMIEFFGTVDSFKKFVKEDIAHQKEIQKTNLENSFMDFRKNNVVYFTSVDGIDSAKWRLEDNDIVVDDEDFTGVPSITRLSILEINKEKMQVKMVNKYDTSIISMKSVKK